MATFPGLLATAPLWLAQKQPNHRLWLGSEAIKQMHWLCHLV